MPKASLRYSSTDATRQSEGSRDEPLHRNLDDFLLHPRASVHTYVRLRDCGPSRPFWNREP
eukprot:645715-Rhodomonas_salina.1